MKRIYRWSAAAVFVLAAFACGCNGGDAIESCDYTITAMVQESMEADTLAASGLVVHAFHAEPRTWKVASAGDAQGGVITNIETGATRQADMSLVQSGEEPVTFAGIDAGSNLFMIVSDPASGAYAWRDDVSIPEGLANIYVELIFKPYKTAASEGASYVELRWNMVNPFVPEEPEPEEPEPDEILPIG